jgi:hypothetical protein
VRLTGEDGELLKEDYLKNETVNEVCDGYELQISGFLVTVGSLLSADSETSDAPTVTNPSELQQQSSMKKPPSTMNTQGSVRKPVSHLPGRKQTFVAPRMRTVSPLPETATPSTSATMGIPPPSAAATPVVAVPPFPPHRVPIFGTLGRQGRSAQEALALLRSDDIMSLSSSSSSASTSIQAKPKSTVPMSTAAGNASAWSWPNTQDGLRKLQRDGMHALTDPASAISTLSHPTYSDWKTCMAEQVRWSCLVNAADILLHLLEAREKEKGHLNSKPNSHQSHSNAHRNGGSGGATQGNVPRDASYHLEGLRGAQSCQLIHAKSGSFYLKVTAASQSQSLSTSTSWDKNHHKYQHQNQNQTMSQPKEKDGWNKEDLWVIGVGRGSWILVRALDWGQSSQGLLHVAPLTRWPWPGSQHGWCLRLLPQAAGYGLWEKWGHPSTVKSPAKLADIKDRRMRQLLCGQVTVAGGANVSVPDEGFPMRCKAAANLHPEQQAMVHSLCEKWQRIQREGAQPETQTETEKMEVEVEKGMGLEPLLLLHGVFGAGKSHTLCAAIGELLERHPSLRIMVAALTNVAVDRVLLELESMGGINLCRLGSVARMHRRLRPFSVQKEKEREREREQGEDEEDGLAFRKHKKQKLGVEKNNSNNNNDNESSSLMYRTSVLGITIASAATVLPADLQVDILIVDESSQQWEWQTAIPLLAVRPRLLVLAGDPCQLPPAGLPPFLSEPSKDNDGGGGHKALQSTRGQGLSGEGRPPPQVKETLPRTLWRRLELCGAQPQLLRRQYRCHPDIANVCSALFYGNRLLHGLSAAERPALCVDLPPILVVLTPPEATEHRHPNGSYSSEMEAAIVGSLVTVLRQKMQMPPRSQQREKDDPDTQPGTATESSAGDVEAKKPENANLPSLGVITTYKEQVNRLLPMLGKKLQRDVQWKQSMVDGVQVSTVDAFQGGEKDVILLSFVRTSGLGFMDCPYRLNVAFSRARHHLLCIGSPSVLMQDPKLAFVYEYCRKRNAVFHPGELIHMLSHPEPTCSSSSSSSSAGSLPNPVTTTPMAAPLSQSAATAGNSPIKEKATEDENAVKMETESKTEKNTMAVTSVQPSNPAPQTFTTLAAMFEDTDSD